MLQVAVGALAVLCIFLVAGLVVVTRMYNDRLREVVDTSGFIRKDMDRVIAVVNNLPRPVQNIFNLDFKGPAMKSGDLVDCVEVEDFRVQSARLYEKLLQQFHTTGQIQGFVENVEARSYSILTHAGVEAIVTSDSRRKLDKALTRLLINGDEEAIKSFLLTTAESICNGPVEVVATSPAMK